MDNRTCVQSSSGRGALLPMGQAQLPALSAPQPLLSQQTCRSRPWGEAALCVHV